MTLLMHETVRVVEVVSLLLTHVGSNTVENFRCRLLEHVIRVNTRIMIDIHRLKRPRCRF